MILKHKGGSNRAGHQGARATTDADLYDNHRSPPLALPFPPPTSPTMVIVVTNIIGAAALASLTSSIPYQHPRVLLTARPFGTPPFVTLLPLWNNNSLSFRTPWSQFLARSCLSYLSHRPIAIAQTKKP